MKRQLGLITLVVRNYDQALAYYCDVLGFERVEDTALPDGKRWVVIRPGADGAALLLAEAVDERQRMAVGNQAGGRVGFFLQTDDFAADHRRLCERGVRFLEEPRHEAYGSVAVFEDIYGNRWDLIEPKES